MKQIKETFTRMCFLGQNMKSPKNNVPPKSDNINNRAQEADIITYKKSAIRERILNRYPSYQIIKYPLNESALKLRINNIRSIGNNSLRGETLSSKGNRWALKKIKQYGIENIIDLREKFTSSTYKELCQKEGLKYFHFPIDSSTVPDKVIIQNFPLMFKVLDEGRCYIACAQGLHRTDIALALNYIFNPNSKKIPVMAGHYQDKMDINDIKRRINSILKNIKDEDLKNLGWGENARDVILERKIKFSQYFEENKPENYNK